MTTQSGKIALIVALLPALVALRPIDEDLFLATFLGDRGKVEALLQDGADVRTEKENGATPLDLAIRRNHPEVVVLLLDHGASINQPINGMSPPAPCRQSGACGSGGRPARQGGGRESRNKQRDDAAPSCSEGWTSRDY